MEQNTSDALLMAGGVLIGIIILTFAVTLFKTTANFASEYEKNAEQTQITTFNNKFEVYNKDNLTIQEVVSVINYAQELNNQGKGYGIIIKVDGEKIVDGKVLSDSEKNARQEQILNLMIKAQRQNGETSEFDLYKCSKIEYSESTQRVSVMSFTKSENTKIVKSN